MKILIIDPYLSASHQVWLDLLAEGLPYQIQTQTLPPYHWKWRMHGSSISLAQEFNKSGFQPDLIMATDMLDLNAFLSHSRLHLTRNCPLVMYFHENQLTYPVSELDEDRKKEFDNHYAFINFSSALAADWTVFNSKYHQKSFLDALVPFLRKFPDDKLLQSVDEIREKSSVIYPGFDLYNLDRQKLVKTNELPIILWNHRWEYDKDPDTFFEILENLNDEGYAFHLAILGQRFDRSPPIFKKIRFSKLAEKILQWGFIPSREEYYRWLWQSDIVVSTSKQDFYGISVIEAMHAKCYPLLPNRLAFPEHIPKRVQHQHLYHSKEDLLAKLRVLLDKQNTTRSAALGDHLKKYHPTNLINQYVSLFERLC